MKARVITSLNCVRSCPGCVNNSLTEDDFTVIDSIYEVLDHDEIILTGGEPMVDPVGLVKLIGEIKELRPRKRLVLYSSFFADQPEWFDVLMNIDGLHYTLHAECTDEDIMYLKMLSERLLGNISRLRLRKTVFDQRLLWRLVIDKRVYDRYDLSGIDLSNWHVVRKLEWNDDPAGCSLPDGEELFLLQP